MVPFAMMSPANAQEATVYIVSYIEVLPSASDQALALLKSFADAARKEDGSVRFELPDAPATAHPVAGRFVLHRPRHPITVIWE